MKEKFTLIIESLHVDDAGDQDNVSVNFTTFINIRFFLFFFASINAK